MPNKGHISEDINRLLAKDISIYQWGMQCYRNSTRYRAFPCSRISTHYNECTSTLHSPRLSSWEYVARISNTPIFFCVVVHIVCMHIQYSDIFFPCPQYENFV